MFIVNKRIIPCRLYYFDTQFTSLVHPTWWSKAETRAFCLVNFIAKPAARVLSVSSSYQCLVCLEQLPVSCLSRAATSVLYVSSSYQCLVCLEQLPVSCLSRAATRAEPSVGYQRYHGKTLRWQRLTSWQIFSAWNKGLIRNPQLPR
jgi:hypothetical protein